MEKIEQEGGVINTKARQQVPSQKVKKFGLLFDKLDVKFLSKPIIQAMLLDRQSLNCLPICLLDDLEPYAGKVSVIV